MLTANPSEDRVTANRPHRRCWWPPGTQRKWIMTALGGIWDFRGGRDVGHDCARMLAAQSVYGPHGACQWTSETVAIGRRLWRLLPEDCYDTQPLQARGGGFVLVADLRLDNREELAAELRISAAQARTMCDAALLLAAFERWDDNCVDRLVGDYAFAVWDVHAHRLVLARDIIGARPLYYHRAGGYFAFASMPKGLHGLPEISRLPDEQRIAERLALLPQGSVSYFKGIERVEAGHIVTVTPTDIRARRHWNWTRSPLRLSSSAEYVEGLRHHLDQSVKSQLRGAEGRVAAQLSGGLDSSAVATTAARLLAPSGGKVIAFTSVPRAGYDLPVPKGWFSDEGPRAAATAAMYANIEHVLVTSPYRSPLDALDRNFLLFEKPMLNLYNHVWLEAINEEVRDRQLTVLLTGQMGNITISYDGNELLPELVSSGRLVEWVHTVNAIVHRTDRRLRGVLLASFAPWLPPLLWRLLCRAYYERSNDIRKYSAIQPARLKEHDLGSRARAARDFGYHPWKDAIAARLSVLNGEDTGDFNKGTLGGWGIDARDPTADRRLVEYCLSVPTEQFCRDGVPRALARAALADRVSAEVLKEYRRGLQPPHVIQHTDRNLSWWRTPGIRSMVSGFVSIADRDVPVVRSSTSRCSRGTRVRSRRGCAMPRCAQRSHRAVRGSRSMR
jgi:asparagine synthase (glutamine-hydrolysing)